MSAESSTQQHSLRHPNETDEEFSQRAERAARVARILVEAALANHDVQRYIADPALPYSVAGVRQHPDVRVEYAEAIAIGDLGSCLFATRNKHWGDGPYIRPLEADDPVDHMRVLYVYKENSRFNRRYEQRRRLKELLGRRYRPLVSSAKSHTKRVFLANLADPEARAIRRILKVDPGAFWQACKGKRFLDLPPRLLQLEFDFDE